VATQAVHMQEEQINHDPLTARSVHSAEWTMRDGTQVEIRSICPADEPLMIKFHRSLSERSVYMRYFETLSLAARTAHRRLEQICFADPKRETVLVATHTHPLTGEQNILAVARLGKLPDSKTAEVAALVSDEYQGRGLGAELIRRLIEHARNQPINRLTAEMLRDNIVIQNILKKLGFRLRQLQDQRTVRATLEL
jgi:acetyltransferase